MVGRRDEREVNVLEMDVSEETLVERRELPCG
jgi:hypothetical protein